MSHSSKAALSIAKKEFSTQKIVAMGHSSILREAIVRGASKVIALPIADDVFSQGETIRNAVQSEGLDSILIGENLDGPFSGASLCGVISSLCNLGFSLDSNLKSHANVSNMAILLKDDGREPFNINITRIDQAVSTSISDAPVLGTTLLEKIKVKVSTDTVRNQAPADVASMLSRKLRRVSSL